MFNFLKEKLKSAVAKLTKGVDEKGAETEEEEVIEEKPKKTAKPKAAPQKKEAPKEKPKAAPKQEKKTAKPAAKEPVEKKEEKKPAPSPKPKAEPATKAAEPVETTLEEEAPEAAPAEEKGFFGKLKSKFFKKEEAPEQAPPAEAEKELLETAAEPAAEAPAETEAEKKVAAEKETEEAAPAEPEPEETEAKGGFFQRLKEVVTKKTLSEDQFEELFWDLEVALLENNVAVEVIEKIKQDLKKQLVQSKVTRGRIEETISATLRQSIAELFDVPGLDLLAAAKKKRPYVIAFVGVNGSGKTTTIAKLAKLFQDKGMKPVIAAGDTFRAAAIQQMEEHANKLGIRLIKHDYGADPAAVAFDAIKYAEAHQADVVLIDTAGRLHSNVNLMDEMKKIMRVAKPDAKIFIGEAITGNDCVEQAKQFNAAVGIDGIILCKADVDEKGGAAISVSYVTGKPILYLGVGQRYEDLKPFEAGLVTGSLGLEE